MENNLLIRSDYKPEQIGIHVIADLVKIDSEMLKDESLLRQLMIESLKVSGATFVADRFHTFDGGGGVTGVIILSESHISIHTYPEYGYAALDYFTCGPVCKPEAGIEYIRNELNASVAKLEVVERTK